MKPTCSNCNDTHRMYMERLEREVMCTHCPTPCQRCRIGGNGSYCARTPCACECHKATRTKTRQATRTITISVLLPVACRIEVRPLLGEEDEDGKLLEPDEYTDWEIVSLRTLNCHASRDDVHQNLDDDTAREIGRLALEAPENR